MGASLSFPGSCYPYGLQRHQGEGRANWELALHLGQFSNWIMGNLRPQANPSRPCCLPGLQQILSDTKTRDLGSTQSCRNWEPFPKKSPNPAQPQFPQLHNGQDHPCSVGLLWFSWELGEMIDVVKVTPEAGLPHVGLKNSQKRALQPRTPFLRQPETSLPHRL